MVSITLYYYCTISFFVVNHFFIFLCITQSTTRCSLLLFQSAAKRKDSLQRNRQVVTYCYFKVLLHVTSFIMLGLSCSLLLFQSAIKPKADLWVYDLCCNLLLFQSAVEHLASSLSLMIRCNLLLFQSAIKPLSLNRIQPISCNLLLFQSAIKPTPFYFLWCIVVTYYYFKVQLN